MKLKKWSLDLWFFVLCPLAVWFAPVSPLMPALIALIISLSFLWFVLRFADFVEKKSDALTSVQTEKENICPATNAGISSPLIHPLASSAVIASTSRRRRYLMISRTWSIWRFRSLFRFLKRSSGIRLV